MTPIASDPDAASATDGPPRALEVATVSSDTLRANVRVSGELASHNAPLLTSILRTHLTAGRRYLRVDLATATISEPAVVDALVAAHRSIAELGGMLVFENAGARVVDAIRASTLHSRPGS